MLITSTTTSIIMQIRDQFCVGLLVSKRNSLGVATLLLGGRKLSIPEVCKREHRQPCPRRAPIACSGRTTIPICPGCCCCSECFAGCWWFWFSCFCCCCFCCRCCV